ncbi:RHS repeat domain-containing protein [Aquimarina sediminis]|uniref:RHS repeat domain-containing protein n=1 Tax=Aquimarina sediminis TaxID=2070536 RepID=UPI000CA01483|nr:RHS repeat-associated core domain-containing protein [Aquimarina sediminis]
MLKKGYRKLFFDVYTDHLGNVRLSYTDRDNSGTITNDEIVEENNYYPFGLQQKGYNTAITGRKHNYKYNNTELEEGLGLNWYEMPLRSYDPTIARWNRLDPVVHHSLSTYNAFDNNPIVFADPSGGNSGYAVSGGQYHNGKLVLPESEAGHLRGDYASMASSGLHDNNRHVNQSEITSYGNNVLAALASFGIRSNCDDCREGQTRLIERSIMGAHISYNEYYHAGGVGEEAGWYSESDYYELFRTTIRAIGQGRRPIESLNDFGFTEDMHLAMVGWAVQAYNYYGGETPLARGNVTAMDFDSPVFLIASLRTVGALFLRSNKGVGGLVSLSEETFSQALLKGAEKVGNYSIYGTKGLIETTFTRNIFLIDTPTKSLSGFRSLINSLESEALRAGANRISIYGSSVINDGFLNPNIMKRFGYSIQQTKHGVLMQKTLK